VIRAEHLSKIFGPNPTSALELRQQGQSKDAIREATGHVVGVDDVSFRLKRGEFFVIMGLSGSGKSTLLRCLNRLIAPTAGRVVLETDEGEIDVGAATAKQLRDIRTRHLTMVFQRFGLLPHRSVRDNVAYGLEIQGVDTAARMERSERALDMVGLGGWGRSRTSELSGGMQQRVGLARALATEAEVMLMDEPFSALDPLIKMQMQQEMIKLQRDLGKTIVFITHDLDEALRLGDRIAIMEDGRVVQLGTPERIVTNPATAYVADFVEHADPTHVITARTVSVELDHGRIDELRREAGGRVIVHRTQPDVEIVVDADDRVREVRADGGRAELVPIDTLLAEEAPMSRYRNRAAVVRADRPLRTLLEARNLCNLPVLVIDGDERLIGLVTEREIIYSIIEKRGRDAMNGDGAEAAA
jgi:glycine betaine/proline transport system ATP-binding protein